ncbi:MAG: hypothetical protein H7A21_10630 [Spirochaetales bacterium]|nr:hypothetical protein [Leptospiraceae bacterium]MCP5481878.1 hypothetical protein [Spirochaetales bacterium]MCP5486315.1 hypothetical protein [Spirochaetales bacterium]
MLKQIQSTINEKFRAIWTPGWTLAEEFRPAIQRALYWLAHRRLPLPRNLRYRQVRARVRLSITHEEALERLARAGHDFPVAVMRGLDIPVRARLRDHAAGGLELVLESGPAKRTRLALALLGRKAVRNQLRLVARLFVLANERGDPADDSFSFYRLQPTRHYPGLNHGRYAPVRLLNKLFHSRHQPCPHCARSGNAYRRLQAGRFRMRRALLIPLIAAADEGNRILPAPFRVGPGQTSMELWAFAFLEAETDGQAYRRGAERRMAFEVYARVRLTARTYHDEGFLPLLALETTPGPSLLPQPTTLAITTGPRGLRLAIGDSDRRLLAEAAFTPIGGLNRSSRLPWPLLSERTTFLQDCCSLDVEAVRHETDYAINRVYRLERTAGESVKRPDLEAFLSRELGIRIAATDRAYMVAGLELRTLSRVLFSFDECEFRSPPAWTGTPVPEPAVSG